MEDFFIPGRLCLFGEHSDWAGKESERNSELMSGLVIVTQTNQGNNFKVEKLETPAFIYESNLGRLELSLDKEELKKIAKDDSNRLKYVAGTACRIISHYSFNGSGIKINNYSSNLPMGKGLSSSASCCVGVAEAFNRILV